MMREDIIEVAVELGLNSGDPQAIAVARELAEAGADADSPPIDDAREGSLAGKRAEHCGERRRRVVPGAWVNRLRPPGKRKESALSRSSVRETR